MILSACLRRIPSPGIFRAVRYRPFTVKAIYSSCPASLAYDRPRCRPSLFDHKENESRPHDLYDEGVIVADDGLVYPGVRHARPGITNGAVMYAAPTLMMKELTSIP
ncbi:uncharacterized protein SPSK_10664 [Sporothrix schenckii 1099-18]|uniref:Uncharacterized protein n=1 Tax=Sporothrix schenckii 1099-18 TaxID=1397361 RepID=A0A0F2LWP6_SPOSC|nr:uncharacterized protein SPSK_10664 [Sporothrix schenckii 1099-18]KJR80321.1 hypothetical protein SPSK_10664 [Sporothrix schenckii 1099-18]